MGKVIYHNEFGANVTPAPNGDVHLSFKDADAPDIDVFPMGKEAALAFAEKIKQKAMGLHVTSEMPKGA